MKPIAQVMQLKYLGVDISSWSNLHQGVVNQENKAASITGCLRNLVCTQIKFFICMTYVKSVTAYGIKTWADTSRTKVAVRTS